MLSISGYLKPPHEAYLTNACVGALTYREVRFATLGHGWEDSRRILLSSYVLAPHFTYRDSELIELLD